MIKMHEGKSQATLSGAFDRLYEGVVELLDPYGTCDSLGRGDYDICPDNYNNRDFFILVNNIRVFRPSWLPSIEALLKQVGTPWIVHIRLGIPESGECHAIDCPAFRITADSIAEQWDREFLAEVLREDFQCWI